MNLLRLSLNLLRRDWRAVKWRVLLIDDNGPGSNKRGHIFSIRLLE